MPVKDIVGNGTHRLDERYWAPEGREVVAGLSGKPGAKTVKELNLLETRRGKSPSASSYVGPEDGFALVVKAGSNISKFGLLIEEGDYIEKAVFDELTDSHLQDGDVLLASTGTGTLGKCCVFRSKLPAIADGHVTVIRVEPKVIYPEYLCDFLRAGRGFTQIERLYTGSTGLIELTPEQVDSIVVDMRKSVTDQMEISDRLRAAERKYQEAVTDATADLKAGYEAIQAA